MEQPEQQYGLSQWVGPFIASLGEFFHRFEWQGAGRADGEMAADIDGSFINSLSSEEFVDPYVEAAFFDDPEIPGATEHFFIVNRRCLVDETQTVTASLDWSDFGTNDSAFYVIDLYTYDTVITGPLPGTNDMPFTTTIEPGQGKLFRVKPVGINGPLPDGSLPAKWQGGIKVAGETVTGSEALTIYPPAAIQMGTDARIEVEGTLNAIGTEGDTIKFISAAGSPAAGDWDWIKVKAGGKANFDYCEFKHGYKGVWAYSNRNYADSACTVSIDHSAFDDIDVCGIEFDTHYESDLDVLNSTIKDCGTYGIRVISGMATIKYNEFLEPSPYMYACLFGGDVSYAIGGVVDSNTFESSSYWSLTLSTLNHSDTVGDVFQASFNEFSRYDVSDIHGAIQVFLCDDSLLLHRNWFYNGQEEHGYGILNFSTPAVITGDTTEQSSSHVSYWLYGLACYGSQVDDPDYPTVRQKYFSKNRYDVWISSNSNCNLGTASNFGYNYLWGQTENRLGAPDTTWTVYNNSAKTVSAQGNYWTGRGSGSPYTFGSVEASDSLSENPFGGLFEFRMVAEPAFQVASLEQNYPNPFNIETQIQFSLPKSSRVSISVYNILGQRIRDVMDKYFPAGTHQVSWDGRDDHGATVASGIYFYRIVGQIRRKVMRSIRIIKCAACIIAGLLIVVTAVQAEEMTLKISSLDTFRKDAVNPTLRGAIAVPAIPNADSIHIDYAELILPVSADVDSSNPLLMIVAPITKEWTPGQVDWENTWTKDGGDFNLDYGSLCPVFQSTDEKEIRLDVTPIVLQWQKGNLPNYGLMVKSHTERKSSYSFIKDGRYSGADAKLRIVYCKL